MYQEQRLDPDLKAFVPIFTNFLNLDDIPAARTGLATMLEQGAALLPAFDDVVTRDEHVPGPKVSQRATQDVVRALKQAFSQSK